MAQLANLSLLTTISCILKLLRDATSHIALVDHRATLTQGHFIIILFYTIQYPLYCTLEFKEAIIMAFNNDYTATILSLSGFEVELEKDLNDFAREEQSLVRFLSLVAIAMLSSYIKFFHFKYRVFDLLGCVSWHYHLILNFLDDWLTNIRFGRRIQLFQLG